MGFESVYNTADHYWPMRNISDNTSSDVIGLAHASIPNGGVLNRTSVFGPAIMLDGLDDCIILGLSTFFSLICLLQNYLYCC